MSSTTTMRPRYAGFTLIELLVVISIIALLIAILLPALGSARDAARARQCGVQLRQTGMGIELYHQDNKGMMPPYVWGNYWVMTNAQTHIWYDLIEYYVSYKLYLCPADSEPRSLENSAASYGAAFGNKHKDWRLSYRYAIQMGYLQENTTTVQHEMKRVDRCLKPSITTIMHDGTTQTAITMGDGGWSDFRTAITGNNGHGFHHPSGSDNHWFIDGHVELLDPADLNPRAYTKTW